MTNPVDIDFTDGNYVDLEKLYKDIIPTMQSLYNVSKNK